MIITLKGADFSANNIGKINMPRVLNSYTLKAIAACGKELTEVQKIALDEVFLAMGVDGSNDVMSKTRKLYLPMIAGDVTKSLVNYADVSMTNDKPNISTATWTLRSNGLVAVENNTADALTLTLNNPLNTNNFSTFSLRTEHISVGGEKSYNIVLRGKSNNQLFLGAIHQSADKNSVYFGGSYGRDWYYDSDGNFIALSSDSVIRTQYLSSKESMFHGRLATKELNIDNPKPITSDMSQEVSQTMYVHGLATCDTVHPFAVMAIGEYLEPEIARNICDKLDALYAAMKS